MYIYSISGYLLEKIDLYDWSQLQKKWSRGLKTLEKIFLKNIFFHHSEKKLGVAYRSQAVLLSFGGNLRGDFPKFSQIDLELISRTFSARFHWRIIISIIYVDIFYRYIMQYSISLMWFVIFLTNSPCLIVEKNLVYIFFHNWYRHLFSHFNLYNMQHKFQFYE